MNCRVCKTEINEDEINNYDKTMCKKCKNEYNKNRLIKLSQNINHDEEKKCTKCNILKDIKDFRIGRNICKKCNNKAGNLNKSNNEKPNIVEKPIIKTKICSKCEIEKPVEDFYKQYGDIYKSECKICSIKYREEYVKTLKGYLVKLLAAAKSDAKKRFGNGRIDAGTFDITTDDLNDLWENQKGLCYYSKLPMNYDKNEWKISLERLNNEIGYVKDNICLVCLEFNGVCQWSHSKILEMMEILNKNIENNLVDFTYIKKINVVHKKVNKTIIEGINHYNCTKCDKIKPETEFIKTIWSGCKECIAIKNKNHTTTPYGHIQKILNSSRGSTKSRTDKNNDKRDNSHDITHDYLIELFNNQKGLCAYSKIPMQFGTYLENNWTVSIERKDPLKGYTKDNVCLICWEFNIFDKSLLYKNNDENIGWTKEKFLKFYNNI